MFVPKAWKRNVFGWCKLGKERKNDLYHAASESR